MSLRLPLFLPISLCVAYLTHHPPNWLLIILLFFTPLTFCQGTLLSTRMISARLTHLSCAATKFESSYFARLLLQDYVPNAHCTNDIAHPNGKIEKQARTTISRHHQFSWCLQQILFSTELGSTTVTSINNRSNRRYHLSCCKSSIIWPPPSPVSFNYRPSSVIGVSLVF